MDNKIYEAQRLMRLANEISPDATSIFLQALNELAAGKIVSKEAYYFLYMALAENINTEAKKWNNAEC